MKIAHHAARGEWLAARHRYINEWPWHDTYGAPDRHEHHH